MPFSRIRTVEPKPQPAAHEALWQSEAEPALRSELLIGRLMAALVHPFAALRLLSVWWWLLILIAYAATAYLVVFGALLLIELP